MNEQSDPRITQLLAEYNKLQCPNCGRALDQGDISWNNGSTEYGTGYCMIDIICQECDTGIAHISSWYPEIEDIDDLVYVLGSEVWEFNP